MRFPISKKNVWRCGDAYKWIDLHLCGSAFIKAPASVVGTLLIKIPVGLCGSLFQKNRVGRCGDVFCNTKYPVVLSVCLRRKCLRYRGDTSANRHRHWLIDNHDQISFRSSVWHLSWCLTKSVDRRKARGSAAQESIAIGTTRLRSIPHVIHAEHNESHCNYFIRLKTSGRKHLPCGERRTWQGSVQQWLVTIIVYRWIRIVLPRLIFVLLRGSAD